MPPEVLRIVLWVALMVLGPGLCLLAMAKWGYRKRPLTQRRLNKDVVERIGWTYVLVACLFFFFVQIVLDGSNGPGGLGSMGNPLAAIVVLGFAFVVAPVAAMVFVAILVTFIIARVRNPENRDGPT